MEGGAIISGAGERGTRETLALPRGEAASVLSDFPAPALLPHYASKL